MSSIGAQAAHEEAASTTSTSRRRHTTQFPHFRHTAPATRTGQTKHFSDHAESTTTDSAIEASQPDFCHVMIPITTPLSILLSALLTRISLLEGYLDLNEHLAGWS
jgi:hypothetical protein